jgi:hypothetical protein
MQPTVVIFMGRWVLWFPTFLCKAVLSSRDDGSYFLGLIEDKDTKLCRNVGIRLATVAASYPREFVCAQIYIQAGPRIRGLPRPEKNLEN